MDMIRPEENATSYEPPRLARLGTLRDLTAAVGGLLPVFGSLAAQEAVQLDGSLTRMDPYFEAPASRS